MTKVLLLTKRDRWSETAGAIAKGLFGESLVWERGDRGDPLPDDLAWHRPDALVSFLSPWIVPAALIEASGLAINFHPGSRHYPGTGCYNFALYEGAAEYGAVAHHMAPAVDTGAIFDERRFCVFDSDTVETLKLRTMAIMLAMFQDAMTAIRAGRPLPPADIAWSRPPFTRRQLNDLAVIDPTMCGDEIARRARAMTYPGAPGPALTIGGIRFAAEVPRRPPLA